MTTNIYLIRHGEVYNPRQILYGRLPRFGLSEKGRAQIEKTAEFLSDKNITAIYTSPLLRTRQTAGIIQTRLDLPKIYLSRNLWELKSSLQGDPIEKWDLKNIDYFSPPIWKANDDTMESIKNRMWKFINKSVQNYKARSIVAVSHGDPIMILKASINNLHMELSSLRNDIYVTHGEVIHIQQMNNAQFKVKSIFIPKV